MKTKLQKQEQLKLGEKSIQDSRTVVLADFTGLSANDMNGFRRAMRAIGAPVRVIKKRVLKIAFEKAGLPFDLVNFAGQAAAAFSTKDLVDLAGSVYRFGKPFEKLGSFKILGGYDLEAKTFVSSQDVKRLGQLPSKEVLLGQLVGMLALPIRSFLFVLNEKAKKSN